jgi:virulence-associated protein VagC
MTSPVETAKVFMTGRSQAVRLPKSCRFDADEVEARRVGRSVVLTPKNDDWDAAVRALFEGEAPGADLRRAPQCKQRARTALR